MSGAKLGTSRVSNQLAVVDQVRLQALEHGPYDYMHFTTTITLKQLQQLLLLLLLLLILLLLVKNVNPPLNHYEMPK